MKLKQNSARMVVMTLKIVINCEQNWQESQYITKQNKQNPAHLFIYGDDLMNICVQPNKFMTFCSNVVLLLVCICVSRIEYFKLFFRMFTEINRML